MKAFAISWATVFALLGMMFIPFTFWVFPWQADITELVFGDGARWMAQSILGMQSDYQEIASDSSAMFGLFALLLVLSGVFAGLQFASVRWAGLLGKAQQVVPTIASLYLAFQLVNYGVDKLLLTQFYTPEPNILYTDFGQLDRDILFWSVMGLSPGYNLFMGLVQLVAAGLLMWRKTRLLGALVAIGVFANIVAINFSFDISVKLYSCFLLGLALLVSRPNLVKLLRIATGNTAQKIKLEQPIVVRPSFRIAATSLYVLLMLLEVAMPGNNAALEDSGVADIGRGAFEVTQQIGGNQAVPAIERLYVHGRGYLILEDSAGHKSDYRLLANQRDGKWTLLDYSGNQLAMNYRYERNNGQLWLQYEQNGAQFELVAQQMNHLELPALQDQFHWAIDL